MTDENIDNAASRERASILQRLHKSDASLRTIFDSSPDAIVTIDGSGVLIDFNPAAEKMFGYTKQQAMGKNVSILMPPQDREEHDEHLKHFRETGRSEIFNRHRETVGCRKDGTSFPMDLMVTHIDDLNLFLGIMRDLTGRKALEREISDISEREREFVGREIHDGLGQQLTALSLMGASLEQEFKKHKISPPVALKVMQEQLKRATSEASALAHGLAPVPEMPHGLSDALSKFAEDIKRSTGINVQYHAEIPPDLNERSTRAQLYRIAQEAVNNAIKHADSTLIEIQLKEYKSGVEMKISDDGVGFDPTLAESDKTLGLRIMQYRAKMISYRLYIESDTSGTTICCRSMY